MDEKNHVEVVPCPHCLSVEGETIPADEDGQCFCWWCSNCKATGPLVIDYERTDEEEEMDIPTGADLEARRLWGGRTVKDLVEGLPDQYDYFIAELCFAEADMYDHENLSKWYDKNEENQEVFLQWRWLVGGVSVEDTWRKLEELGQ